MSEGCVWILFGNGENSRISVTLHQGKAHTSRPADAYVVTGGGLSRSARRAAESVYNWLNHKTHSPDHFVAGFDVRQADNSMAGESGGLAFAIALAARIMDKTELTAAATGEIVSGNFPGQISGVAQVTDKLAGASELLSPGDFFFYPADNRDQLDQGVQKRLEGKGVRVHAVSSVAETLDLLFDPGNAGAAARPVQGKKIRYGLAACLFLIIAAAGLFWWKKPIEPGAPVPARVEQTEPVTVNGSTLETVRENADIASEPTPGESSTDHTPGDKGFD